MNKDYYAGMTEGRIQERDRIIALLEKMAAQQQAVIDFNPNRKDNDHRELVIAAAYQIAALVRQSAHKPDCPLYEGKFDGGCTCKRYSKEGEKGIANE